MTTWLQDGIFIMPLDQPCLGFWGHALDCSVTACLLPGSGSVFRVCLSGAAVCMTAHCATHLNEAFPSDFLSSSGSLLLLILPLPIGPTLLKLISETLAFMQTFSK